MAVLLSLSSHPPKPPQNPNPSSPKPISLSSLKPHSLSNSSKRHLILNTASLYFLSLTLQFPILVSSAETSPPKSILSSIANTKSWFQFFGDGFAIRVPPQFEDIMEPEDFSAGLSLYGDKAKPKTFAARFATPDGSEVLSVVIRPTNQLKITFLEAKDITDLGSLKEASRIFVPDLFSSYFLSLSVYLLLYVNNGLQLCSPLVSVLIPCHTSMAGGSTLYSARTIKIKEDEGFRTYYFYEFGKDEQHVALVAAVNSGKVFIAGATAPHSKWDDDSVKLRSAVVSLTVL